MLFSSVIFSGKYKAGRTTPRKIGEVITKQVYTRSVNNGNSLLLPDGAFHQFRFVQFMNLTEHYTSKCFVILSSRTEAIHQSLQPPHPNLSGCKTAAALLLPYPLCIILFPSVFLPPG